MRSRASMIVVVILMVQHVATMAQCTDQVLHVQGSQVVAGVDVTVTSTGYVDTNTVFCSETFPFIVGAVGGVTPLSGPGAYTFQFDPPIDSAMINVGGLGNEGVGDAEEIRLFVNGSHYSISSVGQPHACEDMAMLTANGDITGCMPCIVSGWNGTTIHGPITTLMVEDVPLSGAFYGGATFSLFICASGDAAVDEPMHGTLGILYPNPATDRITITGDRWGGSSVLIFDAQGRQVPCGSSTPSDRITLDVSALAPGLYALQLDGRSGHVVYTVVID
ncbi:MAG: T9SS type A sorting domain-containing protein [Flavobacteriales bacterium]|nr:T9SS type A sorting domain-containing protein [Flavobacteriales bacterium]MBK7270326.1 T9SS type A sorting domain-containing protein [Flavobacteriales bacterium]